MASPIAPVGTLLAFDPGASTGWCLIVSHRIYAFGYGQAPLHLPPAPVLVERPVERKGPGAVPANDLIKLALRAGFVAGMAMAGRNVRDCWECLPTDWKMQLRKELSHRRIMACIDKHDLCMKGCEALPYLPAKGRDADVWDAIGICLWGVGFDPCGTNTVPKLTPLFA